METDTARDNVPQKPNEAIHGPNAVAGRTTRHGIVSRGGPVAVLSFPGITPIFHNNSRAEDRLQRQQNLNIKHPIARSHLVIQPCLGIGNGVQRKFCECVRVCSSTGLAMTGEDFRGQVFGGECGKNVTWLSKDSLVAVGKAGIPGKHLSETGAVWAVVVEENVVWVDGSNTGTSVLRLLCG